MMFNTLKNKLLLSLFLLINWTVNAQSEVISIDSLYLNGTKILFEQYALSPANCENNNGMPIPCEKADRLMNNNLKDLIQSQKDAISYLNTPYEIILKEDLTKSIYNDKQYYRYFFKYKATLSKKGTKCFSNPGSLLIVFSVYDRLQEKTYELNLPYEFFICDIDLLISRINKNLKTGN